MSKSQSARHLNLGRYPGIPQNGTGAHPKMAAVMGIFDLSYRFGTPFVLDLKIVIFFNKCQTNKKNKCGDKNHYLRSYKKILY